MDIHLSGTFAKTDYLLKEHHANQQQRNKVNETRVRLRRRAQLSADDMEEQHLIDLRNLCLFFQIIFDEPIPNDLTTYFPAERPASPRRQLLGDCLRMIVERWDDKYLYGHADVPTESEVTICYTERNTTYPFDWRYIHDIIKEGTQINLVRPRRESGIIFPELIIVEPDYLIDISRIAACFEQHGHHPLNYLVNTLKPSANTQAILLGNLAGNILDDTIKKVEGLSLGSSIIQNFREKALEYSTCGDFVPSTFKQEAQQQALNIQQAVNILFNEKDAKDKQAFCREKSILEPSFVCEQLGISGRVDLMTSDFKLLVEQKSGKNWNIQTGFPGEHGSYQLEPHYVQLLLYYGVLQQNFHLGFDRVNLRLLYSKYPAQKGLVVVNYLQSLFHEAIEMRNLIVATDLKIAREGFSSILALERTYLQRIIGKIGRGCVEFFAYKSIIAGGYEEG